MCKVSFKHNSIFFHIPKCGGTSFIQGIGLKFDEVPGIEDSHLSYIETEKVFYSIDKKEFFDNCHISTRVRDPLKRMMSLYTYIKDIEKTHRWSTQVNGMSFDEFVVWKCENMDRYYRSCYDHLKNNKGTIDNRIKVIRVETIPDEERKNVSLRAIQSWDKSTEDLIMDVFKKDYELFYPELL